MSRRRQVWLVDGLILLTSGLGVVPALLVREIFDRALFVAGGPRVGLLLVLAGISIALPVVTSVLGVGQTYLTNQVGQQVMRDLRERLFSDLQSLSSRFFTGTRTGEIQSRLANDVGGLQTVITETASSDPAVPTGRAAAADLHRDQLLARAVHPGLRLPGPAG